MQEKRKKIFLTRCLLTFVLVISFCAVFFPCGGWLLISGQSGKVKNFRNEEFEIHFIDVGQGDSIFVRFPDDTNMLVDTGTSYKSNQNVSYLKDLFAQEKVKQIDKLILTHPDSDHVGNATNILNTFEVESIYRPKIYSTYEVNNSLNTNSSYKVSDSKTYSQVIETAYNNNCSIIYSSAGYSWGEGNYNVEFLSPSVDAYSTTNNYSPMIKITYASKSFLLTGDAESVMENEVIKNCPEKLKADVLKVSHHGSKSATSEKFLSYVSPSYAVISVGKSNGYGHPAEETIERLSKVGADILKTSTDGSIVMTVSDGKIIMGGTSNNPTVDLVFITVCFSMAIFVVWGIKVKETKSVKKMPRIKI